MSVPENFISYEDYENIKQEKEFETNKYEDDFSADTESTGNFPNHYFNSNNLTYFDNLVQSYAENWEQLQERTFNPKQPFKIIRNCKGDLLDFQVKVEQEDRVLTKTKRILKREKAKQRVMIKQEISSISDISSKYIPEGFNDPDLDDKTKKKMIQMIRNRISAQNSRDRKKQYVQQLEALHNKAALDSKVVLERNKKLQEENKRLIAMNAQLMEENMRLKACNFTCSNCGHSTDGSSINSPLSNENPPSPNYNNFSGSPKSKAFASFFCIATIISCLMYNNLASQGITLPNSTGVQPFRALGESKDMIKVEEVDPCMVKMESDLNNFGEEILRNIRPLKEEFQQNHLAVYQDMEKKLGFCSKETQPAVKIEEDEHAVVDYRVLSQNFLSKDSNEANKKNLPVLSNSKINKEASTIFVHNGIQLLDEEEKRGGLEDEKPKHDLKNNEFLQLIVPRHSLKNLNLRDFVHTFSNMIENGSNDDNSMLELWVKVFYVRELSSNNF